MDAAYRHCEDLVRTHDKDRFLSSLFAPADRRRYLHALYAFDIEIARIRDLVAEPLPGEVRLQWWRDILAAGRGDEAAGHPVAAALRDTLARCRLPAEPLIAACNARIFDLYSDPMPTMNDLEGYCGEVHAAPLRLAMMALSDGGDPGGADAAGHAGVAIGMTEILRDLPNDLRHGRIFFPADLLAHHGIIWSETTRPTDPNHFALAAAELSLKATRHLEMALASMAGIDRQAMAAMLPLALVRPRLKWLDRNRRKGRAGDGDLPQWRRQWHLWRAARRGLQRLSR